MSDISIGNKVIGPDQAPYIIAEAGINHNGDINTAKKMIDAAKEAGVDAVKFQTFRAEEFCGDPEQLFTYQSQGKVITEPMLDMFKRMELSREEWFELKSYCDTQKITFLSTPQNPSDLELLLELGIDAIKVGSDDFTNIPLLKHYREKNIPLILSCGMADLGEIYASLSAVEAKDRGDVILCLCTSQYPTPPEDVNLKKLHTLKNCFPYLTLGFSDHTQGELASSLAVAYEACLFEKHFTLDNDSEGPDHWFSENPTSLKKWADSIKMAHKLQGNSELEPTIKEREMRTLARRSLVTTRSIKAGEVLSQDNIALRRPGNGLPPSLYESVLGLTSTTDMEAGVLLQLGDFKK